MRGVLWRDTGLSPQLVIRMLWVDARAIFPLFLWLFHWSQPCFGWTAGIAFAGIVLLYLVQRTGMTPLACVHAIRVALMGKRRETRMTELQWRKRSRW